MSKSRVRIGPLGLALAALPLLEAALAEAPLGREPLLGEALALSDRGNVDLRRRNPDRDPLAAILAAGDGFGRFERYLKRGVEVDFGLPVHGTPLRLLQSFAMALTRSE